MIKLKIVPGSTRPTRAADRVLPWVAERAAAHGAFETEVLDLRDWPLPLFEEHAGTIGDWSDPSYSSPLVKRWNATIADGDAFLFVTPEYNHSIPGALKNAIDTVWLSNAFRNKPLGCVAYSGGIAAGVRAVEQLALIAIEAELVPLRNSVLLPFVTRAFDDEGVPRDPVSETALQILLEDLAWWGDVLARARADELPPARARMAAAAR